MKELKAWLRRRAAKDQAIPLVESALFAGQFGGYAFFRLRLFLLRTVVSTLTHTARMTLLWAAFSRETFLQLLLFEAAVGLASSFWWGALEPMRDRVRRLHRHGRTHLVRPLLERWLVMAMVLATFVAVSGITWFVLRPAPDPAALYGLALFIRLALQIATRTYHSGLYALRRIYRPSWAIVTVDLVMLGIVAAMWPLAGTWALPSAMIVASLIGAGLTLHFTRRAFVFFGVVPRWGAPDAWRERLRVPWIELLAAGSSYAIVKLDAVLVFALFEPEPASPGGIELFMLMFVMSPAIQAGVDWAQLFYFDLKRLDHAPLAPLLDQYRRYVGRLAWSAGVVSWALGCLTGSIVYLRSLGAIYWLLLPFFLSRSLAAAAQIQAFSAGRYGTLFMTASLWLVAFGLVTRVTDQAGKLAIVTIASVGVAALLTRVRPAGTRLRDRFVGVVEWLNLLSAVEGPVRVGSATIRPTRRRISRRVDTARNTGGAERLFARRLARHLAGGGAVTCLPESRIAWFEPAGAARVRSGAIAVLSGGLAQRARDAVEYPTGGGALRAAWREHGLEAVFGRADLDGRAISIIELEERFRRWFPDGCVITPGMPSEAAAALPTTWRRLILRDANRFVSRLEPAANSPVDVTALCLNGELRRVFVARRSYRLEMRRRWRALIKRANLLAALDRG